MIATSIEMSRALLDAGISPETADMMWEQHFEYQPPFLTVKPHTTLGKYFISHAIHAWSLSALWNLCKDKQLNFDTDMDSAEEVMQTLVNELTKIIKR